MSAASHTKLLIIDDDVKLCRLVKDFLEPYGYAVSAAHTGPDGVRMAFEGAFDVVILDVMLPGMDGFEVLQRLRADTDLPVLMMTARGEETDRIVGLEMGADDYLPKTFSHRELLARLRAVTRRAKRSTATEGEAVEERLDYEGLSIDCSAHRVTLDGEELSLTPIEFNLLTVLARSSGRVLTREQLLQRAADRDYDIYDRSIDVHISSLRRKLKDKPSAARFIKTVRAAGYMFIATAKRDPS